MYIVSYLSPELIEDSRCGPASDLWALGCILYLLYFGKTPFFDPHEMSVYSKIISVNYKIPEGRDISEEALDLIKRLLVRDPEKRLGGSNVPGYTH